MLRMCALCLQIANLQCRLWLLSQHHDQLLVMITSHLCHTTTCHAGSRYCYCTFLVGTNVINITWLQHKLWSSRVPWFTFCRGRWPRSEQFTNSFNPVKAFLRFSKILINVILWFSSQQTQLLSGWVRVQDSMPRRTQFSAQSEKSVQMSWVLALEYSSVPCWIFDT